MTNTTLDKAIATDFVKFRDRISLFTKKLRMAQYADGSIYDYRLKIAQTFYQQSSSRRSLSCFQFLCINTLEFKCDTKPNLLLLYHIIDSLCLCIAVFFAKNKLPRFRPMQTEALLIHTAHFDNTF